MRIAYLILAHNTPNHLHRMLQALRYEQDDFYIHIDKKSPCSFSGVCGERAFFTEERIPVYWGEFSQVEAIMVLILQALASGNSYDYLILLSGSDYPIRSPRYIHKYLQDNYGNEFINIVEMPNDEFGKPLTRITEYRVGSDRPLVRCLYEKLVGFSRLMGGGYYRRDFKALGGLVPYGGSTWWALTMGACRYIADFTRSNKEAYRFFKNTHCPDETYFQTVIGNSMFKDKVRHNLTYTDWERFCPPFPAWINAWHTDLFANNKPLCDSDVYGTAELLFARKFVDDSKALTSKIDEWLSDDTR